MPKSGTGPAAFLPRATLVHRSFENLERMEVEVFAHRCERQHVEQRPIAGRREPHAVGGDDGKIEIVSEAEKRGLGEQWAAISTPTKAPVEAKADARFRSYGKTIRSLESQFNGQTDDQAMATSILESNTTDRHKAMWGRR